MGSDQSGRKRACSRPTRGQSAKAEAKLKKWGDCEGQESMFSSEEMLTPEIREWRKNHS